MPYRDFVFLHPPGVLLGMVPSVLVGSSLGDAVGMASARIGVILLGVGNAALVATLLRRYGTRCMLLGGGLYAGWGALAYTEQEPMLEPFLVTALLVSLHLFRSRSRWAPLWMGMILGIATMVKVWTAVDLVIFAVVFLIPRRFGDFGRFTLGAAIGGSAVALPFFASAPALMWEMVVTAQLGRPSGEVSLLARATAFGPVSSIGHPVYKVGVALVLMALLAVSVLLVFRGWSRRADSTGATEAAIWAGIALVHTFVILVSSSFYSHYAMFAAAPLTLVAGAAMGWALGRVDLNQRRVTAALMAVVLLVAAVSSAVSLLRASRTNHTSLEERDRMVAWADGFDCTWSSVQDRVLMDEVADALRQGCTMTVDPFGENLLAYSRGQANWRDAGRESEVSQLTQADGLVLPADEALWAFSEPHASQIRSDFVASEQVGDRVLWVRQTGGD